MKDSIPDQERADREIDIANKLMDEAEKFDCGNSYARNRFEALMTRASNHIALAHYYQRRNRR